MSDEASPGHSAHAFQAEVGRLLHLMVHAVYTDREIFLRELISNASDACDKLRYAAIASPKLLGADERLTITISADKERNQLVVADNGIGMDREDLASNLGTIARSGTRAFLDGLKSTADATAGDGLIGQFGVGFYSAFMVADRIEVESRKAGSEDAWMWASNGADGFTIDPVPPDAAARIERGTAIRLHLKPDATEFLEAAEIERIVRTYSDHILFPVEIAEADGARQINTASAIWQRPKSEITTDAYTQSYRTLSASIDAPALTLHYKVEGRQSYAVLLFVPERAPFDLFDPDRKGRVKLYVRRVFITDDAELLPSYLRFVRGVVDSEDVPLNISREMLQKNPQVLQIRKALTARVTSELEAFAKRDGAAYDKVFETFGAVLKEGLYEDPERREPLLRLARFRSTAGEGWRSFADYVAGLRPNQTEIYYLAGDSLERLRASPQIEAARAHGIEVILLTDPVDHFWASLGLGFEGKPFRSLSQGDVDLSLIPRLDTQPQETADGAEHAPLLAALKTELGARVGDVRISRRLVESPVCLVADRSGPDRGLERILARQKEGFGAKPVLEINTGHELITAIAQRLDAASEIERADIALLLYDQARILDGEAPADPAAFATRLNRVMRSALGAAAAEGETAKT
jgi:molecular chaperone HtpG